MHDVLYFDKDDKDGSAFYQTTPPSLRVPAYTRFAKDNTLGLRFDADHSWAIFAEFHHVDGAAWLSPQDNPTGMSRKWNLLLIEAAYRF